MRVAIASRTSMTMGRWNGVFIEIGGACYNDVGQLRQLRGGLELSMRDLRHWSDLLHHKALALRATSDPQGGELNPGSLDPERLAEALRQLPQQRGRSRGRATLHVVADDTEDLLRSAREMWNAVADPEDLLDCQDLADTSDRLAERLENRWRAVRDEWRATGEQLARVIAARQREGATPASD